MPETNLLETQGGSTKDLGEYIALYPYNESAVFDGTYVSTTLSASQTGKPDSFADGLYPSLQDNYTVVIATSTGWNNYRHQADVMDGGIYLSNRFTRVFRTEVEHNPAISLHDLYYQLATHTTGSHAGLYNDACYGNVYRNTVAEFIRPI